MITDIAVEEVEFRYAQSHWRDRAEYDVVSYTDAEGGNWDFYSLDGVPVLSPYTVDGAPICRCAGGPCRGGRSPFMT